MVHVARPPCRILHGSFEWAKVRWLRRNAMWPPGYSLLRTPEHDAKLRMKQETSELVQASASQTELYHHHIHCDHAARNVRTQSGPGSRATSSLSVHRETLLRHHHPPLYVTNASPVRYKQDMRDMLTQLQSSLPKATQSLVKTAASSHLYLV